MAGKDKGRTGFCRQLGMCKQRVTYDELTDGGAAAGTITLNDSLPAGSLVIGWLANVVEAFGGGDVTAAVISVGNATTALRYTGTTAPNVFAAAIVGSAPREVTGEHGPEGTAVAPLLTIDVTNTGANDWSAVTAGILDIEIFYLKMISD